MFITQAWLYGNGACSTAAFNAVFPDGAEVTIPNLVKAHGNELNLGWLMYTLCSAVDGGSDERAYGMVHQLWDLISPRIDEMSIQHRHVVRSLIYITVIVMLAREYDLKFRETSLPVMDTATTED